MILLKVVAFTSTMIMLMIAGLLIVCNWEINGSIASMCVLMWIGLCLCVPKIIFGGNNNES